MKKLVVAATLTSIFALAGVVLLRDGSELPAPPSASRGPAPARVEVATPIQPIPAGAPLDERKVALGRRLFHDTRLSRDGTISCASCHDLARGGSDNRRVSTGVGGAEGDVNAPTVFNSSLNFKQFWDGRANTLEEQIDGPITHPKEMGSTWPSIVEKLSSDATYVEAFRAIYDAAVEPEHIRDAIATFERSLLTPNSRFDRFLEGDASALSDEERAGYELFQEIGCITCHQGANLGGNSFQTFGLVRNYFEDRGGITPADYGRFNVTGKERDKFKFKVPTLRNISKTAPYFHDGSAATLEEAVQVMARYQIGHDLEPGEMAQILAFLRTLDGEYGD
jgi:cytochrome c peroxidase